jgi:aspartyl-tRNA(Asn)/glutamyl-tRNA(Gln) amidotransferase subunit C
MEGKNIKKEDMEYLGKLARIQLSDEEKEHLQKELKKIIGYISQLDKISTEEIEPTYHVLDITNVFRQDEKRDSLKQEKVFKNAPEKKGQYFRVPRII